MSKSDRVVNILSEQISRRYFDKLQLASELQKVKDEILELSYDLEPYDRIRYFQKLILAIDKTLTEHNINCKKENCDTQQQYELLEYFIRKEINEIVEYNIEDYSEFAETLNAFESRIEELEKELKISKKDKDEFIAELQLVKNEIENLSRESNRKLIFSTLIRITLILKKMGITINPMKYIRFDVEAIPFLTNNLPQ